MEDQHNIEIATDYIDPTIPSPSPRQVSPDAAPAHLLVTTKSRAGRYNNFLPFTPTPFSEPSHDEDDPLPLEAQPIASTSSTQRSPQGGVLGYMNSWQAKQTRTPRQLTKSARGAGDQMLTY